MPVSSVGVKMLDERRGSVYRHQGTIAIRAEFHSVRERHPVFQVCEVRIIACTYSSFTNGTTYTVSR